MTFENVSLQAGQQTEVKVKVASAREFGLESNGLRCRLVAVPMTANDELPDLTKTANQFACGNDVTFVVELQNVSDKPQAQSGVRHDAKGQPKFEGKLAPEFFAPHLFEFEFTDANGQPVPRPSRVYVEIPHLLSGALTHEIAPGKSLLVPLRPAKFNVPMDHQLPAGIYRAKVTYRGPGQSGLAFFQEHFPHAPLAKAWFGNVTSNEVTFSVANDPEAPKPAKLVWGEVKDGLQAAVEFRPLPGMALSNDPPGTFPAKPYVSTVFHVKNVSDRAIKFVSETGRQLDEVTATNEAGETKRLQGAFFTGEPIIVRWMLKPGAVAELHALTAGIGLLEQPGKYTLRYRINFGSFAANDGEGEFDFPKKDDWRQILDTGDAPVTIRTRTAEDDARDQQVSVAEPPKDYEGVIESVVEQAIAFADAKVIASDAATKYVRLTEKGEQPAERKELTAGDRVRYELLKGKAATRVSILPEKKDAEQVEGNGLRARVIPVLSSMSEDAIDPAQRVTTFAKADDVAFVVELENVSDKPITLANVDSPDGAKRKVEGWWRPDETKLDAAPSNLAALSVPKGRDSCRKLVLRAHVVDGEEMRRHFTGEFWLPPSSGQWLHNKQSGGPDILKFQLMKSYEIETPASFALYFTEAPWTPLATLDLKGKLHPNSELDAKTMAFLQQFEVNVTEKLETTTVVTVHQTSDDARRARVILSAVTLDGQTVRAIEPTEGEGHVLKLPASEMEAFQISLRPMTHKVTFENVAILPGQESEPTMKVEPLDSLVTITCSQHGKIVTRFTEVSPSGLESLLKLMQHDLNSETGIITLRTERATTFEEVDRIVTKLKVSGWKWPTLKLTPLKKTAEINEPTELNLRPAKPVDSEKELALLQGTWTFANVLTNSWPKPIGLKNNQVNERRWVVKGNEISWIGLDGQEVKLAFTIDPQQMPKQIDFTFLSGPSKGEKCPGIYENLGKSELWICLADPGSKADRPKKIFADSLKPYTWITLEPIPKPGVEPAPVAAEKPVAKELKPFQGIWPMNTCDSENMMLYAPQKEVNTWRWAVKGNEIAWSRSGGEVWHLTFKVDPAKSPKEIDLTYLDGPFKGQTCLGMYMWGGVDKNTLQMSVQDPGAKVPRPKGISMIGGGETSLIFLDPREDQTEIGIAPSGEIVGRLIDAATGKPVEGATIACGAVINDSRSGGGANAVTNAEGRYRLPVPSPGIYNVWLKKFDKDAAMTAAADDGLLVEAGKVTTSTLLLAKQRKVAGKVVDADGRPMASITVNCNSAGWPPAGSIESENTKLDGTFEFSLPPGRVFLYVFEQVGEAKDRGSRLGREASAQVNVTALEEVEPVTLVLAKPELKCDEHKWLIRSTPGTRIVSHEHADDVTGTVVDVAGKPIAGAIVIPVTGPINLSDDKGTFKVSIETGTHFIMHAFAPGYHVWFGTPTAGEVLKIVLEKKEMDAAKIGLKAEQGAAAPKKLVELRLLGGDKKSPLADVEVVVPNGYGSSQMKFGPFKTDDKGKSQVSLEPGTYDVHLNSNRELPYLPIDDAWSKVHDGISRRLNFSVTEAGVGKWSLARFISFPSRRKIAGA